MIPKIFLLLFLPILVIIIAQPCGSEGCQWLPDVYFILDDIDTLMENTCLKNLVLVSVYLVVALSEILTSWSLSYRSLVLIAVVLFSVKRLVEAYETRITKLERDLKRKNKIILHSRSPVRSSTGEAIIISDQGFDVLSIID